MNATEGTGICTHSHVSAVRLPRLSGMEPENVLPDKRL